MFDPYRLFALGFAYHGYVCPGDRTWLDFDAAEAYVRLAPQTDRADSLITNTRGAGMPKSKTFASDILSQTLIMKVWEDKAGPQWRWEYVLSVLLTGSTGK